jgi:hypothetical protein
MEGENWKDRRRLGECDEPSVQRRNKTLSHFASVLELQFRLIFFYCTFASC